MTGHGLRRGVAMVAVITLAACGSADAADSAHAVTVGNEAGRPVRLELLGQRYHDAAIFEIEPGRVVLVAPPPEIGTVRGIFVLDEACAETARVLLGEGWRQWPDIGALTVNPDASLRFLPAEDLPRQATPTPDGPAVETDVCGEGVSG